MQERQMKSKEIDRKADKKQTTCIVGANEMQNQDSGDRIAILKQKVIALPPKPPKSELTPYLEIIAILIQIKNYSIPDVLQFLTRAGSTTYPQQIEHFKKRREQLVG